MLFNSKALLSVAFIAGFVLLGTDAYAAADATMVGNPLLQLVEKSMTNSLGLFLGLCLAVFGIWTWVVKQETLAGLLMIVGGVLIQQLELVLSNSNEIQYIKCMYSSGAC